MSATVKVNYKGDLCCDINYLPANYTIKTDVNNGEAFSPSDLFVASLGACVVSSIGFAVKDRMPIKEEDISCEVEKEMADTPKRVDKIKIIITIANSEALSAKDKEIIKKSSESCPIKNSISEKIDVQSEIVYK